MTWLPGVPDPLCALCSGGGKVVVRAGGAEQGSRAAVVWARLVPATVAVRIEAGERRDGDRMVDCPSCSVADAGRAGELEGQTIVMPPRAARSG